MIKNILIALLLATGLTASAQIERFPYEDELAELYFDVDVDCNRLHMQEISEAYVSWVLIVNNQITTKQDCIYVARLSHMFGEVATSYHYGN